MAGYPLYNNAFSIAMTNIAMDFLESGRICRHHGRKAGKPLHQHKFSRWQDRDRYCHTGVNTKCRVNASEQFFPSGDVMVAVTVPVRSLVKREDQVLGEGAAE